MKEKILIIIPARAGSKGIKNKNLKKIKGVSLLQKTINVALSVKYKNKFIAVSTDSTKMQKIAKKNKVWCEKLRPKKISGDYASTNDAISHILKNIFLRFDFIIQLQPTYFFRSKSIIEQCIKKIIKKNTDSVVTVNEILNTSHPDYCLYKTKKQFIFKKNAINFSRQLLKPVYQINGVCLICKSSFFEKNNNMIGRNLDIVVIKNKKIFYDINDEIDLKIANYL